MPPCGAVTVFSGVDVCVCALQAQRTTRDNERSTENRLNVSISTDLSGSKTALTIDCEKRAQNASLEQYSEGCRRMGRERRLAQAPSITMKNKHLPRRKPNSRPHQAHKPGVPFCRPGPVSIIHPTPSIGGVSLIFAIPIDSGGPGGPKLGPEEPVSASFQAASQTPIRPRPSFAWFASQPQPTRSPPASASRNGHASPTARPSSRAVAASCSRLLGQHVRLKALQAEVGAAPRSQNFSEPIGRNAGSCESRSASLTSSQPAMRL